jgi:hypothetical protein
MYICRSANPGHVRSMTRRLIGWRAARLPPDGVYANFNVTLSLYFASPLTNGRFLCIFTASEALILI